MTGMPGTRTAASGVAAEPSRGFRTRDLDQARAELSRLYYPLRIDPVERRPAFSARLDTVSLGPITLGRLSYGCPIVKDCGDLQTAFHVNVPLHGEVRSRCGDQQVLARPGTAAVFNPSGRTVLDRWAGGATQLCLKIDRVAVEGELEQQLDRRPPRPLCFRLGMDLAAPAARGWMHAVRMLADELDAPGGFAAQPLLAQEVQRLIVNGLLWGQAHSCSAELAQPGRAPRPRTVKLAMDRIESRPEHPWTMSELAAAAGISVRSMEDGFRRYVGVSPLAYLRACRLDRVHADLLAATPGTRTVADVAYRWGFAHLGRFARAYRERFGCNPSETLRS